MTFERALMELKRYKKVRRPFWGELDYLLLRGNRIKAMLQGEWTNICSISYESILADDWELVEDLNQNGSKEHETKETIQ